MPTVQGYIGRSPGDSSVIISSQTFEPSGIQTDFTFTSGYDPGYIDVYLNGSRLIYANDYTATDGSTVGLTTYANNGDVLELVAYKAFNVGAVTDATGNFTVGQNLTVNDNTTISGNLTVEGSTTLAAGSSVAYATTSFGLEGSPDIGVSSVTATNISATGQAVISGITTVSDTTESTATNDGALVILGGVGIAKSLNVGGNITVGGTLTYEDVTNQDVLGIGTYREGLNVGSTQGSGTGVAITFTNQGNAYFGKTGVVTATTFKGALTGNVTGNVTGNIDGTTGDFSGAVTGSTFSDSNGNIKGVGINSAGTNIGYGVTTLNFIGSGNTFAISGNTVDISISGGGGGSGDSGGTSLDITSSLFI